MPAGLETGGRLKSSEADTSLDSSLGERLYHFILLTLLKIVIPTALSVPPSSLVLASSMLTNLAEKSMNSMTMAGFSRAVDVL